MKNYTQVYVKNSFEAAETYCKAFGAEITREFKNEDNTAYEHCELSVNGEGFLDFASVEIGLVAHGRDLGNKGGIIGDPAATGYGGQYLLNGDQLAVLVIDGIHALAHMDHGADGERMGVKQHQRYALGFIGGIYHAVWVHLEGVHTVITELAKVIEKCRNLRCTFITK